MKVARMDTGDQDYASARNAQQHVSTEAHNALPDVVVPWAGPSLHYLRLAMLQAPAESIRRDEADCGGPTPPRTPRDFVGRCRHLMLMSVFR